MILTAMQSFFDYAVKFITLIRIADVVDIFIIAIAAYYFMMAIKGTRAVQLVKGILVIIAVYMLSSVLQLHTLNYILGSLVQVAMFGVIVIFQPELRNLLEKVGQLKVGHFIGVAFDLVNQREEMESVISEVSHAAAEMSQTKTGCLIVMERRTRLGEYMNSGTLLNANVSTELLENIFTPNTPLHDGAVIIRGTKIITAGCVLPLTANVNLASELGTRHRAALGLSEASDSVIVVVSEETGKISIAINGSLTRNLSQLTLKKALTKLLITAETDSSDTARRKLFRKTR